MSLDVKHIFSGREYAKEIHIPAGYFIEQHVHKYDHISILAEGLVFVLLDGEVEYACKGPTAIVIPAGKAHRIEAITDAVWYCVHATEETDPEKVDDTLIMEGSHVVL